MNDTILDILNKKVKTGRHQSQINVFKHLHNRFSFNPITILETGCIRNDKDPCDGWGTYCWNLWAERTGSRVFSIDSSKESIASCQNIINSSIYTHYVYSDSIKYLENLPESFKINLLFLDSYDYWGDSENKKKATIHQLNEIKAVEKNLIDTSFILIDDVFDISKFSGKGELSIPYLLSKGWKILHFKDTQIFLSK